MARRRFGGSDGFFRVGLVGGSSLIPYRRDEIAASLKPVKPYRLAAWLLALCAALTFSVSAGDASGMRPVSAPAPMPSALIELDGTGSENPDGGELGYSWKQVEGPRVQLSDPRSPKPTFRTGEPGLYRFELVVSANGMSSEPFIVEIMIERDNLPPVAIAPEEAWGEVGKIMELNGSESYDPEELEITYRWRSLTPGLELPRNSINQPKLVFTPVQDGVFEIELLVSDGENVSQAAVTRVLVRPKPRPPVARAKAVPKEIPLTPQPEQAMVPPGGPKPVANIQAPTQVKYGEAVLLDARGSRAQSGNKLEYLWRQKSGPFVSKFETALGGAGGSFKPPRSGEYIFELVVTDGVRDSEPVSHMVRVINNTEPPVAVVVAPERIAPGALVRMDASQSYDPDGQALTYRWRQTGGPRVNDYIIDDRLGDAAPGFRPAGNGMYSFELVVSNGKLQSKPIEIDIQVGEVAAPQFSLGITGPGVANVGDRVMLGAATTGAGNRTLDFAWRQVEGPSPAMPQTNGNRVVVSPTVAGRYVIDVSALEQGAVLATARQVVEVFDRSVGSAPQQPLPMSAAPLFHDDGFAPPPASESLRPSASAVAVPVAAPRPMPELTPLQTNMPAVPSVPPPLPTSAGASRTQAMPVRAAAQIHPSSLGGGREASSALDPLAPLQPLLPMP